jgi:hypothetical protein
MRVVLLSLALSGCMSINIESPCRDHDVQFGWGTVMIKSCVERTNTYEHLVVPLSPAPPTPPSTITPD